MILSSYDIDKKETLLQGLNEKRHTADWNGNGNGNG